MKFVFHASVNPGGLKQFSPEIHPTAHKQQICPLHSWSAPLFQDTSGNFKWYFLSLFQGSHSYFILAQMTI